MNTTKRCIGVGCENEAGSLQCPTCLKLGKESSFCSQDCFKRSWVGSLVPLYGTFYNFDAYDIDLILPEQATHKAAHKSNCRPSFTSFRMRISLSCKSARVVQSLSNFLVYWFCAACLSTLSTASGARIHPSSRLCQRWDSYIGAKVCWAEQYYHLEQEPAGRYEEGLSVSKRSSRHCCESNPARSDD